MLSEAVLDDILEDTARAVWMTERQQVAEIEAERLMQGPTLESMLLRMEEMEVSLRWVEKHRFEQDNDCCDVMDAFYIYHCSDLLQCLHNTQTSFEHKRLM